MPGADSTPDETSTTSGARVLIALTTLYGLRPPASTTAQLPRSRARSTASSLHGSACPVPPSRVPLLASRRIASALSKSISASAGMWVPAILIAAQTSPRNLVFTAATSAIVGSAWSCTMSRFASSFARSMSPGSFVPKTPTRLTPLPAASRIRRPCCADTRRGPSAKITPIYRAPISAASAASSGRVMPQNLTFASTTSPRNAGERTEHRFWIAGAGQLRTYQHSIGACVSHALHVGQALYPTFGNGDPASRKQRKDSERGFRVDLERLEVSVIDSYDGSVPRQGETE